MGEDKIIINAIGSIKQEGILGFSLRDNKVNICDRIKRLGLNSEDYGDFIIIKDERFNDVVKIQLHFNTRKLLDLITVYMYPKICIEQLVNFVSVHLKCNPILHSQNMCMWKCENGCNIDLINKTDFNSSNMVELSFGFN